MLGYAKRGVKNMIENYLLEEFIAFADTNSVYGAAQKMKLSQPAITRGMKKLEHELGVKLFIRKPNKIILTETGKFAVKKAKKALAANKDFSDSVKTFAQRNNTEINIASIALGPLLVLDRLKSPINIEQKLEKDLNITKDLENKSYTCIISDKKIENVQITSTFLGNEVLFVLLNKFIDIANHHEVSFSQLDGTSFLLLKNVGLWQHIFTREMPNSKLLYQSGIDSLNELLSGSVLSYFLTNLSCLDSKYYFIDNDHIPVKIKNSKGKAHFYLNYLIQDKEKLSPIIQEIKENWPPEKLADFTQK